MAYEGEGQHPLHAAVDEHGQPRSPVNQRRPAEAGAVGEGTRALRDRRRAGRVPGLGTYQDIRVQDRTAGQ